MSAEVMTPGESAAFGARVVTDLLVACPANEGGPHRWRASDIGETIEPVVPLHGTRYGIPRTNEPMKVRLTLTAECICGVTVSAEKKGIAR